MVDCGASLMGGVRVVDVGMKRGWVSGWLPARKRRLFVKYAKLAKLRVQPRALKKFRPSLRNMGAGGVVPPGETRVSTHNVPAQKKLRCAARTLPVGVDGR